MRILIVDDELNIRKTLRVALEAIQHAVEEATGTAEAIRAIERHRFDVALVDLRLGNDSGLDLLAEIARRTPRTAVVIITAHGTIDTAVEAMRRGAFDYLPKPFTPAQVRAVLQRLDRVRNLQNRVADLEDQLADEIPEISMESADPGVRAVLEQARKVAATDAVVLIRGESGTGKGVLARAIHAESSRSDAPFVTVSCPSLSAELLESELFGHARGAFTGAVAETEGKVAAAEGGSLFLDEIGDLPLPLQPKLLRFLQERRYERVGESRSRSSDARLIAATNRDLDAAVAAGAFREDLLFRINVVELALPPLRERADRLALGEHLLAFFARRMGKRIEGLSDAAREAISRYPWPGNLRELRNAMERAAIFASGTILDLGDLPERITAASRGAGGKAPVVAVGAFITLEQLEAEHIRMILERTTSREDAAKVLGIDPSTLYRKRKQLGF
jgi:NtrC-family two-component system response regulator AlgB